MDLSLDPDALARIPLAWLKRLSDHSSRVKPDSGSGPFAMQG